MNRKAPPKKPNAISTHPARLHQPAPCVVAEPLFTSLMTLPCKIGPVPKWVVPAATVAARTSLDRSGALTVAQRPRQWSRFHSTGTILPDAHADITSSTAAVPPRTLGQTTRGLLVIFPGILLPDFFQPHPIRQHRGVFRSLFEAMGDLYSGARDYTIVWVLTRVVQHPRGVLDRLEALARSERFRRYCKTLYPTDPSSCGLSATP